MKLTQLNELIRVFLLAEALDIASFADNSNKAVVRMNIILTTAFSLLGIEAMKADSTDTYSRKGVHQGYEDHCDEFFQEKRCSSRL